MKTACAPGVRSTSRGHGDTLGQRRRQRGLRQTALQQRQHVQFELPIQIRSIRRSARAKGARVQMIWERDDQKIEGRHGRRWHLVPRQHGEVCGPGRVRRCSARCPAPNTGPSVPRWWPRWRPSLASADETEPTKYFLSTLRQPPVGAPWCPRQSSAGGSNETTRTSNRNWALASIKGEVGAAFIITRPGASPLTYSCSPKGELFPPMMRRNTSILAERPCRVRIMLKSRVVPIQPHAREQHVRKSGDMGEPMGESAASLREFDSCTLKFFKITYRLTF